MAFEEGRMLTDNTLIGEGKMSKRKFWIVRAKRLSDGQRKW